MFGPRQMRRSTSSPPSPSRRQRREVSSDFQPPRLDELSLSEAAIMSPRLSQKGTPGAATTAATTATPWTPMSTSSKAMSGSSSPNLRFFHRDDRGTPSKLTQSLQEAFAAAAGSAHIATPVGKETWKPGTPDDSRRSTAEGDEQDSPGHSTQPWDELESPSVGASDAPLLGDALANRARQLLTPRPSKEPEISDDITSSPRRQDATTTIRSPLASPRKIMTPPVRSHVQLQQSPLQRFMLQHAQRQQAQQSPKAVRPVVLLSPRLMHANQEHTVQQPLPPKPKPCVIKHAGETTWLPVPFHIVKSKVTCHGTARVQDKENVKENLTPISHGGAKRPRANSAEEALRTKQEEERQALLERQENARCDVCEAVLAASHLDVSAIDLASLQQARDNVLSALNAAREVALPRAELWLAQRQRRRLHNAIQDRKGRLRVCCRVRPLSDTERRLHDPEVLRIVDDSHIELLSQSGTAGFEFNGVFGPECSQDVSEEIFQDSRDLAQSAVDGHNVTVFTYGQTGAGKTYTMFGNEQEDGLVQALIRELFDRVAGYCDENQENCPNVVVTGSALELYNNHLVDLLRPVDHRGRQTPGLKVCSDAQGAVEIEGMAQIIARSPDELLAILRQGLSQRTVAQHALNIESSRSHLIFTVKLAHLSSDGKTTGISKLTFCDLGGCERLKRTQVVGELQKEAIEINKSLTALGDVIEAVAGQRKHVPYRNHKLTQLLRDAVGGTAKVLMYVCCSPAKSCATESAAALKLASRAKGVANQRLVPEEGTSDRSL